MDTTTGIFAEVTSASLNGNSTTLTPESGPYPSRKYELAMCCFLTISGAYLLLAAVTYNLKYKQDKFLRDTNWIMVAVAATQLLNSGFFFVEILPHSYNTSQCYLYFIIHGICSLSNRSLLNTVLWLRQKQIYSNQTLPRSTVRKATVVSYVVVVGFVVLPISQVATLFFERAVGTDRGCYYEETSTEIYGVVTMMLFILCQFVLIALVLLPLVAQTCNITNERLSASLRKAVIRVIVCSIVCVVTDLAFMGIAGLWRSLNWASITFFHVVFACNAFINMVSLVFSFKNYAQRFFPFKAKANEIAPTGVGQIVEMEEQQKEA